MTETCNNIDLKFIPDKIFRLITKDINWFELVELYQKVGNENNYLIENSLRYAVKCENNKCDQGTTNRINSLGHIKIKHILEFMGAYRKVLIDAVASETIKYIRSDDYNILGITGETSIGNCIVSSALGSTNITSDYDITFTGPGAWKIVNCLVNTFKKYVCGSLLSNIVPPGAIINDNCDINTMSGTFDSNFYLMPDIVVNSKIIEKLKNINVTNFFDLNHEFPDSIKKLGLKRIIPIPDKSVNELEYLKLKIKDPDPDIKDAEGINNRYNELVELAKQVDNFLYKEVSNDISSKGDYFKKVMDIKRKELEAYYCVSTVLVVVFGMQGGEFKKTAIQKEEEELLINKLSSQNFLISAIENMIDVIKHHRHNFTEEVHQNPEAAKLHKRQAELKIVNNNVAKKFSKYFQRIYVSLYNYHKKKKIEKEFSFNKELELSNYIVSLRGKKLSDLLKITDYNSKFLEYKEKFNLDEKLSYNSAWVEKIKDYLNENGETQFNEIVEVGNEKYSSTPHMGGKKRRFKKKRSRKKNKRKKNKKKQTKKR